MVRLKTPRKCALLLLAQFLAIGYFIVLTTSCEKRSREANENSQQGLIRVSVDGESETSINQDDKEILNGNRASAVQTPLPYDTDIVIGVPTIKRPAEVVYLGETVRQLIDNRGKIVRVVVLIYIAEEDAQWATEMARSIKQNFTKEIDAGLIRVITPPKDLYPNWDTDMKITLNDARHQVKWRSKQNIDASYLMQYAHGLNTKYYLGIEDDVIPVDDYLDRIWQHANEKWSGQIMYASYCPMGAIGKLFFKKDLLTVSIYLRTFWNYKPLDWLYFDLKALVACGYPRVDCELHANDVVLDYKHSLFIHAGKVSSLVKNES